MQYITHFACWCKTCNVLPTWHVDAKHAIHYTLAILVQNMHYITHLACWCKTCNLLLTWHVDVKSFKKIKHLAFWCKTCNILHTWHVNVKHATYYALCMLMQNMQYSTHLACWWIYLYCTIEIAKDSPLLYHRACSGFTFIVPERLLRIHLYYTRGTAQDSPLLYHRAFSGFTFIVPERLLRIHLYCNIEIAQHSPLLYYRDCSAFTFIVPGFTFIVPLPGWPGITREKYLHPTSKRFKHLFSQPHYSS